MSIIKKEDGKKWISSLVAVGSLIFCYIVIKFIGQIGEWVDLEAKIPHFATVSQGIGIFAGLVMFIGLMKNAKSIAHLNEVYGELVKVVWPEKDSVVKVTIGIVIGLIIISSIFVGVDFSFRKILELIY